ncbi:hypothetical protein AAHA92_22213 [Salvia divinorum]|uniref:Uncharacterized protein n=1 Tax=Salvia divinorum TaxID=28513 RepID=A0ABD1GMZ7_SALDI
MAPVSRPKPSPSAVPRLAVGTSPLGAAKRKSLHLHLNFLGILLVLVLLKLNGAAPKFCLPVAVYPLGKGCWSAACITSFSEALVLLWERGGAGR